MSGIQTARPASVVTALSLLLAGCSGRGDTKSGDWVGTIDTVTNVTSVRTRGGSVWGGMARLLETASIGGSGSGDEYLLGEVRGIAATDDIIYVIDLAVPVVRMYDHSGSHLGDVGRRGEGPGEFERPLAIALDSDTGHIFVRDSFKARINVYSLEGVPLETWRIQTTRPFTSPLVVAGGGTPYTQIVLNPSAPFNGQRIGMASCGAEGIGADTLEVPEVEFRPLEVEFPGGTRSMIRMPVPFGPELVWAMTPHRALVVGASEEYRFEIHYPDGRITVIEKPWDKVPVENDEASWTKGRTLARIRIDAPGWQWQGPGIPEHKPPFQRFIPDRDGRIWVVRQGRGRRLEGGVQEPEDWMDYFRKPCWEDTYLLDAFEDAGRYLGEVEVPHGMLFNPPPWISGDEIIALVMAGDGTPRVKKYRLLLP